MTEAKRAIDALRAERDRSRSILESMAEGVLLLDRDWRVAEINAEGLRIAGHPREAIVGRHLLDVWPEVERLPSWPDYQRAMAEGAPVALEYWHVSELRDAWLDIRAYPVAGGGGLAVFYRDVTDRKRAEAALRESEARLRLALDAGGLGDFEWDVRTDVVRPSARAREIFAFAPGEGERSADYYARILPEDVERTRVEVERSLALGRIACSYRIRLPGGAVRHVNCQGEVVRGADGAPARLIGVFADETEREQAEAARKEAEEALRRANETLEARVAERTAALRQAVDALHAEALERERAEEHLRQAQKMEAVGQLTGGIAHDFNNMLQAIGSGLEMMQRRVEQGRMAEARQYAEGARRTVERAAALTHRLLAFARRQSLQPRPVEPDSLVEGMAELIRRTVGPAVQVELRMGDGIWTVLCDPNQLENALLNLAINARDAMPEGGRLTICTEDICLIEADLAGQDGAAPGDYVEITVSDAGSGMDEATRARAFEPFFTTKPVGQGTGLGLSQVYGFVRQSGGVVRLDSALGRGTTVRLYLPRHKPAERDGQKPATSAVEPKGAGAGDTVLLVEDETGVRAVAAERLRELGYWVLEAADGLAALRVLRSAARLDLLVTDVGLPGGLNGRQVAEVARERRPALPVLFITGYAGGALEEPLAPGMAVIGKPFTLDALAARVRAMLEEASLKLTPAHR